MAANTNKNNSRVALITGGTKGIGFEVARQLAERGIQVLIGSHDEVKGEQAAEQLASENLPATYIQIDVTNQASIDLAFAEVENAYGGLDILINNSNLFLKEPRPSDLPMEMLRQTLEVNFFGTFSVIQAFLPLLRQSASARIVNVSSEMGSFHFHEKYRESQYHFAYSVSKSSLNMLTVQLAKDLKNTRIKINSCIPGVTDAELKTYHGHSIEHAIKSIIYLATLPDDGPTGKFVNHDCAEEKW